MKKPVTPIPLRSCFDDAEGYNALGCEIQDKMRAFMEQFLLDYPDVVARDMQIVIGDVVDGSLIFHRTIRLLEHMKAEEAKTKVIAG